MRDWFIVHIVLALVAIAFGTIIAYFHEKWRPQKAKGSNLRRELADEAPRAAPWGKSARHQETSGWALFGLSYFGVGYVLGIVAGVLTFVAAYIYCIATYGFLFGLGLGWLPSGILATLVAWAVVFLWGPILVVFILALIGTAIVVVKFG